jgi:hypothetical protein
MITLSPGDRKDLEYRSTVRGGTTVVEFRGDATVDVTRASDGAMLDEFSAGGPRTETYVGNTVIFSAQGPSILVASDDAEAAEFEEEGLPRAFSFASGTVTEVVVLPATEGVSNPDDIPPVELAEITQKTQRGSGTPVTCWTTR